MITYSGRVVDAETDDPLPFVQINHIYKFPDRDSIIIRNLIADKDGHFRFQSPRVMNNRIEVICLGYKILTRMLSEAGNQVRTSAVGGVIRVNPGERQPEIHDRFDLGVLKLTPDVQQLDEVVVKARIDLFKRVGDTLFVFPKNVKQFEGDALIDLLKRHPSFRVDEQGNIYVDGKRIERAMLNGKHVFGEDVRTMVHSILAKEAGLIKVYDENDETSEILKGEEFADKRRVMNVITFKDFNLFKGGEVRLEGGVYADEDASGDRQTMHAARGKLGQYASHFRISVEGDRRKTAFPREQEETGAGFNAEVSTPDLLKVFVTRYNYGRDAQDQESRTRQTYFPTPYFETQVADRDYNSRQDKDAHDFSLKGKYVKKKEFSLSGGYSGTPGTTGDRSLSVSRLEKDGEPFSYLQQLKESDGRNDKHGINLKFTRSLKKAGNIQFAMNGGFDKKSSDGIRVDTSYSGGMAERRVFNTFTKAPYHRLSADLTYSKNFKKYSAGYDPSVFYQ
ncbi:MAG: hypothetical protein IJ386_09480, partial [Clostridia bacterium]|nr:hypothetical protein [Clostridia bacterium]